MNKLKEINIGALYANMLFYIPNEKNFTCLISILLGIYNTFLELHILTREFILHPRDYIYIIGSRNHISIYLLWIFLIRVCVDKRNGEGFITLESGLRWFSFGITVGTMEHKHGQKKRIT